MTAPENVIQQIASELAPELARLMDTFLGSMDPTERHQKAAELKQFLWDNKVGFLRVAEHAAKAR